MIRGFNHYIFAAPDAEVAELADALDSGSSGHCARAGSSPALGTNVLFSALNGSSIATNCAYPEVHFVYVLLSLKDRNLYIGFSKNIIQRFNEHQRGKVRVTKNRRPFVLLYWECFPDLDTAVKNEKHFKKSHIRRKLKLLLKNYHLFP